MGVEIVVMLGRRYSGRAYRLRTMRPSEVDAVTKEAAKRADAGMANYVLERYRLGVCRSLEAYTAHPVPMKEHPLLDEHGNPRKDAEGKVLHETRPDAEWLKEPKNWTKPDPLAIELPGGYDQVIDNAKDDSWLNEWWRDAHDASVADLDRIMGKAQKVSGG